MAGENLKEARLCMLQRKQGLLAYQDVKRSDGNSEQ
jgi:hypothetical protein